jgi:peptide-methionine (S)-S-oxide reductase
MEQATFGAGCFWAVEAAFQQIPGVIRTSVGYMGGHFADPCHWDVVARITGHAEVAQVEFDPAIVTYATLLATFWEIHDPTSLNRQGADRGEQYRSVIFCHTPEQEAIARAAKLSQVYDRPIVTEIKPAGDYWLANDEHQQYFAKKRLTKLKS